MTEISPEAEAAGKAAEIAVEHAQEEQQTREIATEANINSAVAEDVAEAANANANEALANAENAGSAAIAAAGIATDASENAQQANESAQEAKSEVAELRDWLGAEFGRLHEAMNPPKPDKEEVKEVDTGSIKSDNASGDNSGTGNGESGKTVTSDENNRSAGRRRSFHR